MSEGRATGMREESGHAAPRDLRRLARKVLPRLAAGVAFGCAGFLAVTSSVAAEGTDLRAERQTDLPDLVTSQAQQNKALAQQKRRLDSEVTALMHRVGGADVEGADRAASELAPEAGLTAMEGPGLTITLNDAPREMRDDESVLDVDALVVHQQDIQAVANAMWAGGAEAVMIQGKRLISTSAIRCVGNSVVLHGVAYPPPYEISAVGDVEEMIKEIYRSKEIGYYLDAVDQYQLGWELRREPTMTVPAYQGVIDMRYASTDKSRSGHGAEGS